MSQLRQFVHDDGATYVCLSDIEAGVQTHQKQGSTPFRLAPSLSHATFPLKQFEDAEGNDWLELHCTLKLLDYCCREVVETETLPIVGGLVYTLKESVKQKRAVARKNRWLVAFRQEYKCAGCGNLLYPLAFDIDHAVELRDGGKDQLDNLQALCSNCHAAKTRSFHSRKKQSKKKRKHEDQ